MPPFRHIRSVQLAAALLVIGATGGLPGCDDCSSAPSDARRSDGSADESRAKPTAVAAAPDDARNASDRSDGSGAGTDAETNTTREGNRRGAAARSAKPDGTFEKMWTGHFGKDSRFFIQVDRPPFRSDERPSGWKDGREAGGASAEYRPDRVQRPFRGVERVDVLTSDGPIQVKLTEIRKHVWGQPGAEETDYFVVSEAVDSDVELPEIPTLVTPAGRLAENSTFRPADPEEAEPKLAKEVLSHTFDSLSAAERKLLQKGSWEKLSSEHREHLRDRAKYWDLTASLGTEHVSSLEARFPAPHAKLVTVAGPETIDGVGRRFPAYRGVHFVDDSGRISATVWTTLSSDILMGHVQLAELELLAVADPDGDGTDGVLFKADDSLRWLDFAPDGRLVQRSFPD